MEEELVMQILETLATIFVAGYSVWVFKDRKKRFLFLLMIVFFYFSRVIDIENELFHEWAKHIPFYIG